MEDLIRELQCIKRDGSWAASVRLRDQHPVCRKAATALAERDAELAATKAELARMRGFIEDVAKQWLPGEPEPFDDFDPCLEDGYRIIVERARALTGDRT